MRFEELVTTSDDLMGVKAVYGPSIVSLIAFGSRANLGHHTAKKALERPYLLSIGGGAKASDSVRGRVLEVMRVTPVYGSTSAFINDPILQNEMKQWPVATMLSEVFTIGGQPHIVDDLGFPDGKILEHSFDSVRRNDLLVERLWQVLKNRPIERRYDIMPPPGFIDRGEFFHVVDVYPTVDKNSEEGQRLYKEMRVIERCRTLVELKKRENKHRNSGRYVCESCGFADKLGVMFDVHHLFPLHAGSRLTNPTDLAVLCPTCHRWAHAKGIDWLNPMPVRDIMSARSAVCT